MTEFSMLQNGQKSTKWAKMDKNGQKSTKTENDHFYLQDWLQTSVDFFNFFPIFVNFKEISFPWILSKSTKIKENWTKLKKIEQN